MGAAGSGAPWKGDLGLPGTAEETDAVGGQTAFPAWAGTAQRSERGRTVEREIMVYANRHRPSNRGTGQRRRSVDTAQSVAGSTQEGPGQRSGTSGGMTDTVCANGRDGRVLAARKAFPSQNEHGPQRCCSDSGSKSEDRAQVERRKGLEE